MLGENIKRLRNERGMSQEAMAERLSVVRQTVSKWEKGLSVPDADMLGHIADLFQVRVGDLLDEVAEERDIRALALQLALLNEQLANKARRTRTICRGILIALLIVLGLWLIVLYENSIPSAVVVPDTVIQLTCTLDGETYDFTIDCDAFHRILSYGGDPWIFEHVLTGSMRFGSGEVDASALVTRIEDYFTTHGGTVELQELAFETFGKQTHFNEK